MSEFVVVVGGTGAFGSAICSRLVQQGFNILVVGRNPEKLASLASQFPEHISTCATDISQDASIQELQNHIPTKSAIVRALVHGPGVVVAGGILEASTEALSQSVDIKVGGLLRLVRAFDDQLVKNSRIIAIAGHYGLEPTPYAAAPGIANAALFNAVRQLSLAYGARGITAHTLAPGPADTERLHRVADARARLDGVSLDEVLEGMKAQSSINAFTTPEQVAWAVSTLLDPEASAMTGSTIMLDSGRRKGLP